MSDTYFIAPRSGRFSEDALQAWHAFLGGLPTRRFPDGMYQVFETVRERDEFAEYAARTGRQLTESAEHVLVEASRVTLHIIACALPGDALAAFLEQLSARTALGITDPMGNEMTIARLCKQIGAVPRGDPPD